MATLTYKYLGDRDLSDAKVLLQSGSASMTSRLVQQSVEKNLKQFIEDNGDTLMDITFVTANRDHARKVCDNWRKNTSKHYKGIIEMLLE